MPKLPHGTRRRWMVGTGAMVALALSASLQPALARVGISGYSVSQAELQAMLNERFPRQFPVAGLATLELQAPALELLPEANRLRARVPAVLSGPTLVTPREGSLEIEFGLRYEAQDRTLRAHGIAFRRLEIPGLDPVLAALLQAWAPRLARRALGEVVLHQLAPKDLALLDGLGLRPGAITVTQQGLSVAFEPKPL